VVKGLAGDGGRPGRSPGSRRIVLANGTECEPASGKDKALLVHSPHVVLDGISLAAETVGADEAVLCMARTARSAIESVASALHERSRSGRESLPIRIELTPDRFVAGEESALVHWLNGGEAKPTFVPPRPFERGVGGRPTLVNNVETLAHLALIARFGAEWYRGLGTEGDPGTALVTVSGAVDHPGVYEIPFGVAFSEVMRVAGERADARAVLIGGYSGVWVDAPTASTLTLDSASLRRVGATLGCGAISIIGADSCGLGETARVTRWLADQSAGQCGPCTHGLPAISSAVDGLVTGDRDGRWQSYLHRWLAMVEGRGACHHPDGVVRFVRGALSTFSDEIERHRRYGPCPAIQPTLPTPSGDGSWR
jgi:NADH:ubiquinone oxidoreductase subunit F (NADH-binding)